MTKHPVLPGSIKMRGTDKNIPPGMKFCLEITVSTGITKPVCSKAYFAERADFVNAVQTLRSLEHLNIVGTSRFVNNTALLDQELAV